MNVLLVSEPGIDGVFRYVENLAHHLLDQGSTVHLAYSDVRGGEALQDLVDHVEDSGGRTLNLRTSNHPCLNDVRALFSLRKLVRELQPDVIHSHSAKAGALARALPLLGVVDIPQVYQPHAYVGMRPARGRLDFAYDVIERVLGRWSTTITCSYDEQRYALHRLRIGAARVPVVSNGIDTARFAPGTSERRCQLRAEFGLPADALVLGAMCRSSDQKDPVTLYRAFAAAATCDPRLVLFHVGRGELDPDLDRIVAEHRLGARILRRPYLAAPADFYQVLDGFALTSRYEGLSLALLEALSADLPLIVTDAPGNGDLLLHPLSHLWRGRVGDVDGIACAIKAWADDRSDPTSTPCNHREIARAEFDQRRAFARIATIYRRVHVLAGGAVTDPGYARA